MIRGPFHARWALVAALFLGACAGDGTDSGETGTDTAPAILIAGIADGTAYDNAVAIQITIDHGAFQATLDGLPYSSGDTVRTPGSHVLAVAAHAGLAATTREIHFSIKAPTGGALIIRMINLGANDAGGGGDAILVTDSSAAGQVHTLIDAGPSGVNGADPAFVARKLASLHVDTLAFMLLTHAHSDHYDGMSSVLSAIKIKRFLYNGQVRSLSSYNAVITQARNVADSLITVTGIRDYDLGSSAAPAHLKIVPPLATHLATTTDDGTFINDGSVGAHLQMGTFTMFFTGDGEVAATARWRTSYSTLTSGLTVLKVGHHGANNAIFDDGFSGTSSWLTQVAPKISIISGNGTTHPRVNALARLLAQPGNRTYCTNVHGNIDIRVTRTGAYTVSVERNADKDCTPGSSADS